MQEFRGNIRVQKKLLERGKDIYSLFLCMDFYDKVRDNNKFKMTKRSEERG